jgi:MraZ protein
VFIESGVKAFMALFLSTFVNKIDKKGRVSVPASFRASLSNDSFIGFVAFRSYKHDAIECFSYERMLRLSNSIDNFDVFSDASDDLTAAIFADSLQLSLDGDGRVILPKDLLDHASIEDQVAFVGRGATFQLWSPERFKIVQDEARARIKASGMTIKLNNGGQDA